MLKKAANASVPNVDYEQKERDLLRIFYPGESAIIDIRTTFPDSPESRFKVLALMYAFESIRAARQPGWKFN